MLEKIRQNLLRKALRSATASLKRQRKVCTLETAQTIGLLFDATAEKFRREILDIARTLEKTGKKINLFAFFDDKKSPGEQSFDFFFAKEISFSGIPNSEKAAGFQQKKLDLLLCFNPDQKLQIEWVAAHSQAAMKIGYATALPNDYDIQLEIPAAKGPVFFMDELKSYLDKIVLTKK